MTDATASLLDATLDDLADLPEFKQPPSGAYILLIKSFAEKKVNDEPSVEVKFVVRSVEEMADPGIDPKDVPEIGMEFGILFNIKAGNDVGIGFFKEFMKPLGEKLGTGNLRQIMSGATGMEGLAVVKTTHNTKLDRMFSKITSFTPL